MHLFLIIVNLLNVLIHSTYVCGHINTDFKTLVDNEAQPHVHSEGNPGAPAIPPQGEKPALWSKYQNIDFMHDLDHLREEANQLLYLQKSSKISNEDSAFYYTRLHDFNSDGKLDGLELLLAVKHSLVHNNSSFENMPLEDMTEYVDTELTLMDLNNDGFVDYGEIYTYMENNKKLNQQQNQQNVPQN